MNISLYIFGARVHNLFIIRSGNIQSYTPFIHRLYTFSVCSLPVFGSGLYKRGILYNVNAFRFFIHVLATFRARLFRFGPANPGAYHYTGFMARCQVFFFFAFSLFRAHYVAVNGFLLFEVFTAFLGKFRKFNTAVPGFGSRFSKIQYYYKSK